jgi:hypothetical protein
LDTFDLKSSELFASNMEYLSHPNGFELTCGAVSMRARFAREIKLPLIYEMHFQTADCLDERARACRDGRLSELLVATTRV